ncbi:MULTISPECIES: hypothetical protein [Sphingobacterium]|uniref:hypothetical protein n=1 Tax=Sphingobacterium TaxID=28453 RepID=UPI0013DBA891|nr:MULTISPECIES: hypothetical protein [unclassified Sphingobacterium]
MSDNKKPNSSLAEFVHILLKYMEKFGLEAIDIAFLAFTNRINIENLITLKGSLELERMQAIAQAFNMQHYQFSNPKQKMPEFETLPERTKRRITFRKEKGTYTPESKNSTTVNDKIAVALSFLKVDEKFLTEKIANQINMVDSDTVFTTTLVGDRLAKSFSKFVEKTEEKNEENKKVGAKPFFYKVTRGIPGKELNNSIEILGNYWFETYKEFVENLKNSNGKEA